MIKWERNGTVGKMQYLSLETNRRYCVDPLAVVPSEFARFGHVGNSEVNSSVPLTRNPLSLKQLLRCHAGGSRSRGPSGSA